MDTTTIQPTDNNIATPVSPETNEDFNNEQPDPKDPGHTKSDPVKEVPASTPPLEVPASTPPSEVPAVEPPIEVPNSVGNDPVNTYDITMDDTNVSKYQHQHREESADNNGISGHAVRIEDVEPESEGE